MRRRSVLRQQLRRARLRLVDLLLVDPGRGLDDPTPERIEEELVALGLLDLVRDLLPADGHKDQAKQPAHAATRRARRASCRRSR